jgi:hypothetical protein
MSLIPVAQQPGFFADPTWKPDSSGTFAVIIGASKYPHLDGTAKTYHLDQLTVSALTAHCVFDWLRGQYRFTAAPLAQCWVLLAPSSDEVAYAQASEPAFDATLKHAAVPTFDACEEAIRKWFKTLKALPKAVARESRSVFFFCGHGLELTLEKQILLPSDYLGSGFLNDAISVPNLRDGCGSLAVRDQFFFIDACRNDHETLRGANIRGAAILDELSASAMNPDRNSALVYASAAGTRAFSPLHPKEGPSIFGQALVEGLLGTPDVELKCDEKECALKLHPLHNFLTKRVPMLLKARGATVQQRIPLNGPIVEEPIITRLDRPKRPVPPPEPPPKRPAPAEPPPPSDLLITLDHTLQLDAPERGLSHQELFRRDELTELHPVFGSETVTQAWREARLFSLTERRWHGSDSLTFHDLQREGRDVYRTTVSTIGHEWLQVAVQNTGSPADSAFAAVLPNLGTKLVTWDLDIFRDQPGAFVGVDVNLSPMNAGDIGLAALAWRVYATQSARDAVESPSFEALAAEVRSPLAALVVTLLSTRAYARVPPRAWKALKSTTSVSDPSVLVVEHARRSAKGPERDPDIIERLMAVLEQVGLPVFGESFGYLERQIEEILDADKKTPWMPYVLETRVRALQEQIAKAMGFFRPGGLAASFITADPSTLSPDLILPVPVEFTTPPITTATPEAEGGISMMA